MGKESNNIVIKFEVHGRPASAGSKRPMPVRLRDGRQTYRVLPASKNTAPWMTLVKFAAGEYYRGPLLTGPISLQVTFLFHHPKSHYGKTGLRKTAPKVMTTKPDLSKLVRAVEDAMTGVIWKDDSQVTQILTYKIYSGKMQGVRIRVEGEKNMIGRERPAAEDNRFRQRRNPSSAGVSLL